MKVPFLTIVFVSSVVLFMVALARAIDLGAAKFMKHGNMNHHLLCRLFPDFPRFPGDSRCNEVIIDTLSDEKVSFFQLLHCMLSKYMPFVRVINQKNPCLVKSITLDAGLSDTTAGKQLTVDSNQNENILYEYYYDADSLDNIQNGSSLHVVPNIATEQGRQMISNQTLRGKIKLA